jgi:Raf kinase inhibitor-like YbhB/YbcL family protein
MKKYTLLLALILCIPYHNSFANSFAKGFTLESPAFKSNSLIPEKFTCKGDDKSPPLVWRDIPAGTKSFVLIVEDPDAPKGVWTHWILFNIPVDVLQLDAGSPVPPGATQGKNSWGTLGYRGPCPPVGAHSYHFKLYAISKELNFGENITREVLLDAITGYVVGSTELIGIYQVLK